MAEPILIKALNDQDPFVQINAARSLGKIDAKQKALAVPVLVDLMTAPSDIGIAAASSFGTLGSVADAAIPELVSILKRDRGGPPSQYAAYALSQIGAGAVPALVALLNEENGRIRWVAADALMRIGVDAKSAIPGLTKALQDEDPMVRSAASRALGVIDVDAAEHSNQPSSRESCSKQ